MAHYAQLDQNNVVTQVIVINNDQLLDENGEESEAKGLEFIYALFGKDTAWVQTSYNGNFRGKYAAIGDLFDGENFVSLPPPEPISFIDGDDYAFTIGLDQTGA